MKFSRIGLQVNTRQLTSYFQYGGHEICPPLHTWQRPPAAR